MNPNSGPDLSITMGQSARLVATAGQWYSTQAAPSSSSWSAWSQVSPSQPIDHIMIRQNGGGLIAVGLDYNCSTNCNIYGMKFYADGTRNPNGFFVPGSPQQGAAHSGPVAITSRPSDSLVFTLGTNYEYFFTIVPYPCSSTCGNGWVDLGAPANNTGAAAPASARLGSDLEFVFTSGYSISMNVYSYQYGSWSGWLTL